MISVQNSWQPQTNIEVQRGKKNIILLITAITL